MVRAVAEYLVAHRQLRVMYAPLRTDTHTAAVLGLLGLRSGAVERGEVDRQGQPRLRRDQHPALREDP
eukprot:7222436-Alexandrium_andersonii.AAC.1